MATLQTAVHGSPSSTAIILPCRPTAFTATYADLSSEVETFRRKLADMGVGAGSPVSMALANSYEFVVSFLAASRQRAVAAPLNPAYKKAEFEFYLDDVQSAVVLVPRGAHRTASPAVQAAQSQGAAVAECYWDPARREVVLDVKDLGRLRGKAPQPLLQARPHDVALVLHTSGTTSRPKVVPLSHRNLTTTMSA